MDREVLAPLLALVVLLNVAAIVFVLSGRRWTLGARFAIAGGFGRRGDGRVRLRLTDMPVPTVAAWERVLAAESIRHAHLGRPATVVALRLVGLDVVAERDGAARAALLRRLALIRLRGATRASDPLGWDGAENFGILLLGADASAATVHIARALESLRPWIGGPVAPVQLAIGCVSPTVGGDLQVALDHAQVRMAATRSRARLRTVAA